VGLPNVLSISRLLLVPVFIIVYFSGLEYATTYAAIIFLVASLTDVLDGMIARKYGLTSRLGKILDPLGDKVMTFTVLICITIDRIIPLWAVLVFAAKEVAMGLGGLLLHKRVKEIPPSNFLGKTSTVVFFVICMLLMLFPSIPPRIAKTMISTAIGVTLIAFGSYIITFSKHLKAKSEPEHGEDTKK